MYSVEHLNSTSHAANLLVEIAQTRVRKIINVQNDLIPQSDGINFMISSLADYKIKEAMHRTL